MRAVGCWPCSYLSTVLPPALRSLLALSLSFSIVESPLSPHSLDPSLTLFRTFALSSLCLLKSRYSEAQALKCEPSPQQQLCMVSSSVIIPPFSHINKQVNLCKMTGHSLSADGHTKNLYSITISVVWTFPVITARLCTLKNALHRLLVAVLILAHGAYKARLTSLLLGIPRAYLP